jgi:hypothetical protein
MAKRCYYEVLEVERTAGDGELKAAFRKLAMKWHPDRNPGDKSCETRFKEINEAYEILKDPDKRAAYDRFGHAAFEHGVGPSAGGGFGDVASAFADIFDDLFGMGGGRRGRGGGRGRRGRGRHRLEAALSDERHRPIDRDPHATGGPIDPPVALEDRLLVSPEHGQVFLRRHLEARLGWRRGRRALDNGERLRVARDLARQERAEENPHEERGDDGGRGHGDQEDDDRPDIDLPVYLARRVRILGGRSRMGVLVTHGRGPPRSGDRSPEGAGAA